MNPDLQTAIEAAISQEAGEDFHAMEIRSASGGCIHQSYLLRGENGVYFVKVNDAARQDVFVAEAAGLKAISQADTIACPGPIHCGSFGQFSYLIMEGLTLSRAASGSWELMGQQLAQLHRKTADRYGWHRDNYIGASPQHNDWHSEWADFFCQQRLRPQFEMARANGVSFEHEAALYDAVRRSLTEHRPEASLLHGDLWSGNAGFLENGQPVIYDPATYYGDRETDLAFSEFFGGFPAAFYQAYNSEWPLPPGYQNRKELYNLYHVLNHANLFGGGYAAQARNMIGSLIK